MTKKRDRSPGAVKERARIAADDQKGRQDLFLGNFKAAACNIKIACEKTGIDRNTYYNWLKKSPEFETAVKAEREGLIDFAESKLIQQINTGNIAAICFFLKTQAKHRGYIERAENEMSGRLEVVVKRTVTNVRPEDEDDDKR